MLMKLPKSTETKCDGKLGWLPIGMEKQCREIIHEKAFEAFHNMRKTGIKYVYLNYNNLV